MRETRVRANGARQRPWREVHRGRRRVRLVYQEAVPVSGEGAGTRVRGEATHCAQKEGGGRQRETTPPLNQHFQKQTVKRIAAAALVLTRSAESSTRHFGV